MNSACTNVDKYFVKSEVVTYCKQFSSLEAKETVATKIAGNSGCLVHMLFNSLARRVVVITTIYIRAKVEIVHKLFCRTPRRNCRIGTVAEFVFDYDTILARLKMNLTHPNWIINA